MLRKINIRNFALIETLEVDFTDGFSVITGETGTGKSVLLGAISMLLGQRSDAKAVREGAEKCIIEGEFDLSGFNLKKLFEEADIEYDEECCIVRRELSATGRSRAFINDTPVAAAQLKELGNRLIDIHSQHQNLLLGDNGFQLRVIDRLTSGDAPMDEYQKLFDEYNTANHELKKLQEELENSRKEEDFLRFRLQELTDAALVDGEEEELEQEEQELTHAEDIQTALYSAYSTIDSESGANMLQILRDAKVTLSRIAMHYPAAEELSERLENSYIELKDCCGELRGRAENITFAPDRLEYVTQRLALLGDLQKKHRATSVKELIEITATLQRQVESIDCGDEEIKALQARIADQSKGLTALAAAITAARKKAAAKLQEEISKILVNLGMPLIRFEVAFEATPHFTANGCDAVEFMFSANSISAPQPLASVASGGEMSRVMLAIKSLIANETDQPTLIFDEIDTGISGILAERMGLLMKQIGGEGRQVISITHLPQVAALGASHYKVYKEETEKGTKTDIIKLEGEARVREIAQMVSGEKLTDAAMDNARLLLSQS